MRRRSPGILVGAAAACLLAAMAAQAHAESIFGDVTKQFAGKAFAKDAPPLPRVELKVCPTDKNQAKRGCFSTITGSDGSFFISEVPPGEYKIMTDSSNGRTSSGIVVVTRGKDLGISIKSP